MRLNAALWALLALHQAYAGKMTGFKSENSLEAGKITVQLKAENFVNPQTVFGELAGIKLLDHKGACINCVGGAVCKSPNTPDYQVSDAQKACNTNPVPGDKWSWKVNKSSPYDIMLEYPLASLNHELKLQVEIISAVDKSGTNSEEQKGRQVTSWLAAAILGTETHRAWLKVAVNLNGDFTKAVKGDLAVDVPKSAEDLYDEVCLTPNETQGYLVTETSMARHKFSVGAACATDYTGSAKVTECELDQLPYRLSGCRAQKCSTPKKMEGYDVRETDMTRLAFDVSADCAPGFSGFAKVTKCAGDGKPYSVEGCMQTTTTTSTTTTTTTTTSTTTTTFTTTTTTTSTSTTSTSTTTITTTTTTTITSTTTTTVTTTTTTTTTFTTTTTTTSTTTITTTTTSTTTSTTSTSTTTTTSTVTTTTITITTTTTTTSTTTIVFYCRDASDAEKTGYGVVVHTLEDNVVVFSVNAWCADGYYGTAKVDICETENHPYKLSGCHKIETCETPETMGYALTVGSRNLHDWNMTVECDKNWHGSMGRVRVTNVPKMAPGYVVSELELRQHSFQVTVKCAAGYAGTAKSESCTSHFGEYKLSGCTRIEAFCVAPSVTDGYLVTEKDLRTDEFKVTATCAAGWSGTATVSPCVGSTPQVAFEYKLSGCSKTTR
ncbi:unnamed protein product [Effrenium voratum]|nr:unnamed protein product [Effrenium voratum]